VLNRGAVVQRPRFCIVFPSCAEDRQHAMAIGNMSVSWPIAVRTVLLVPLCGLSTSIALPEPPRDIDESDATKYRNAAFIRSGLKSD
jgi:hypothetical protein